MKTSLEKEIKETLLSMNQNLFSSSSSSSSSSSKDDLNDYEIPEDEFLNLEVTGMSHRACFMSNGMFDAPFSIITGITTGNRFTHEWIDL